MSNRYDNRNKDRVKVKSRSKSSGSSPSDRVNKYRDNRYKKYDYTNKYNQYNNQYRYNRDRNFIHRDYRNNRYNTENTLPQDKPKEMEANKEQPQELNTFVLVANNVSRNVTKKHLSEIFGAYGNLKGVYVPKDNDSKLSKGYVYLEYVNKEDAENAYWYMNGGQLDGQFLKVEFLNTNTSATKEQQPEKKKRRSRSRKRSDSRNLKHGRKENRTKYDRKKKESSSSESSESSSEESSSSRSSS
jgi:RNA recognition motif-containing protein